MEFVHYKFIIIIVIIIIIDDDSRTPRAQSACGGSPIAK